MFRVKIKIMESKPADVARDAWRVIQREGMTEVADYWFKNMFPNHFTPQAKYIYHHKPRSKKWNERKEKWAAHGNAMFGGKVDNVFTGAMLKALQSRSVIRGFPSRATIYLYGPDYLKINFKKSSNQPNKPQEIFTKTANELQELRKVLRAYITERLRKHRGSRKTTTV